MLRTPSKATLQLDSPTGALSGDLLAAVDSLRKELLSRLADETTAVGQEGGAHLDTLTLARFQLAAVRGSTKLRPADMWLEAMRWRLERGVVALFDELHPVRLRASRRTTRQELAYTHGYAGFGGLTRAGVPYFIERLGRADLAGIARDAPLAELLREHYVTRRGVRTATAAAGQQSSAGRRRPCGDAVTARNRCGRCSGTAAPVQEHNRLSATSGPSTRSPIWRHSTGWCARAPRRPGGWCTGF